MEQRTPITIRFPNDLLESLKRSLAGGESINSFVLEAVERAVRRREGLEAHERIIARRQQIEARTGRQPSSVDLIRELREGSSRDD